MKVELILEDYGADGWTYWLLAEAENVSLEIEGRSYSRKAGAKAAAHRMAKKLGLEIEA